MTAPTFTQSDLWLYLLLEVMVMAYFAMKAATARVWDILQTIAVDASISDKAKGWI